MISPGIGGENVQKFEFPKTRRNPIRIHFIKCLYLGGAISLNQKIRQRIGICHNHGRPAVLAEARNLSVKRRWPRCGLGKGWGEVTPKPRSSSKIASCAIERRLAAADSLSCACNPSGKVFKTNEAIPQASISLAFSKPLTQCTVVPPLTWMFWPVTKPDASLARYVIVPSRSCGTPQRPIGMLAR